MPQTALVRKMRVRNVMAKKMTVGQTTDGHKIQISRND